ncbi:hypothetical protein JVT61DRAFT_8774 [Boletus reticuloceps]|uniref:Uncharacterized protein n=1 Tax=Boletus reticuloceps TaxID=495285 RepID=A0A8I3A6D1_9AGAM|nr:hypothetical protein JVT61DRAFT_8774 [Boletus reticuloceps]
MDFELPPPPVVPEIRHPAFPPHVKIHEADTEVLLLVVAQDLTAVTHTWSVHNTRDDTHFPR